MGWGKQRKCNLLIAKKNYLAAGKCQIEHSNTLKAKPAIGSNQAKGSQLLNCGPWPTKGTTETECSLGSHDGRNH